MTPIRRLCIAGGLLICSLGMPRVSFGISGCTNAYLTGTYNATIASANVTNVLNTLNSTTVGLNGGFGANSAGLLSAGAVPEAMMC